ncbi:hypothetical protein, partial [uncultured Ruegeria sp.]|uniref:hypothetical protein n=1 Tax=uncultured Ruegeria sp. TaxID=259304 RepID=UPI0026054B47
RFVNAGRTPRGKEILHLGPHRKTFREAVIRCNGKIGKRKNVKRTFMRMGSSLSRCSILDGRRATKCL